MSLHAFHVEDSRGDLVDLVPFCSDSCHRQWCRDTGAEYRGWNGCMERPDYDQECASCSARIAGSAS